VALVARSKRSASSKFVSVGFEAKMIFAVVFHGAATLSEREERSRKEIIAVHVRGASPLSSTFHGAATISERGERNMKSMPSTFVERRFLRFLLYIVCAPHS